MSVDPNEPRRPSLIDELAGRVAKQPALQPLATTGLFLIAAGAVLYVGRSVFIPLMLALLLSFVFGPVVRLLHRAYVPKELGSAMVLVAVIGVLALAADRLSGPAVDWAGRLPQSLLKIEDKVRALKRPVGKASELAQRVERLTDLERPDPKVREVHVDKGGLATTALQTAIELVLQAAIVFGALYFMLIYGDSLLQRVIGLVPDLRDQRRTAEVIRHVERRMSQYLGTISAINVLLGGAVGLAVHLLGMPNALLWGTLAALLHFIPYLGSAVGIGVVTLASLTSFPQLSDAFMPPLAYLAISTLEGNLIGPLVLGRTFRVSPLILFVWLVLWGWLWGIAGAIIAVPLLMLIKVTCEQSKDLAPIAAFLGR